MCPAEWRVVCSGAGLPSEAMRRRADEEDGPTEDMGKDGGSVCAIVSCSTDRCADASLSLSAELSLFALRRNFAALRLAMS